MDRRVIAIAGAVLLIGLAFITYQQVSAPPVYHGSVYAEPKPATDFTLQSDQGPVRLSDLRGQLVLLYFGYTYCPDVCPTTLGNLKKAFQQAGKAADNFQVVFISVDPRRDTPARLGEYARFFNPEFIGVTGSEEDISTITADFGIHYHLNDSESDTSYTVDHTSVVIVIDPQGNQLLVWPHDITPKDMAIDMKNLVKRAP